MEFSLTSFMVYFLMLMLLSTLLFQGAARVQAALIKQEKRVQFFMQLCSVHDVLERDLYGALPDRKIWQCSAGQLIWHCKECAYGWQVIAGAIYRLQGQYNDETKSWSECTKSLIAQNCHSVFAMCYDPQDSSQVIGVRVQVQAENNGNVQHIERIIMLRTMSAVPV